MKRQRGRNRGGGGGGKPQAQNANRAFDSNGPEGVKVRGNAQHVFEKYQQLARDATSGGDRVLAENYLQHAEHYFRVVRAMQPTRPASEILGRDQFSSGFDIDFEDESGAQAAAQADADAAEAEAADGDSPEARGAWRERDDRQETRTRDDRPREERGRDDRPRFRDRDDRPRDERPRDERPREDRPRDERPRDDRPRDERPREDRPPRDRYEGGRRDRWRERDDRPERAADPLAVVEPQSAPLVPPVTQASPVLRDVDGGESDAPAFLKTPRVKPGSAPPESGTAPAGADEVAAKPARRKRAPRPSEGGADASETEDA